MITRRSGMGDRIRVLYVVGNFVAGGAERHLLELWSRIDRERFSLEIACFQREGQFTSDVERLGWPIHDLAMSRRIYDLRGLRGLFRLIRHALRFRPQVIHGYLFGPNLFAVLAGRWCRLRAVVISKRNIDAFETPRQIAVQRLAHRLATHVVAVSSAVAESSVALGVPADRVTVITNGVDVERFASPAADMERARNAFGINGGAPIVGSVGCLEARKNYSTLLAALGLLHDRGCDFHAVLVGEGRERRMLEDRSRELGIEDRVQFLGERSDVERLLPLMDVFVLSSREEGIPNALLEAMAAGRPAVATAVGGTPEVLSDGETGWLVAPGRPAELADAIQAAIRQPREASRRGAAARRVAEERLSIRAMVERHEDFYRRVSGWRQTS